MKQIKVNQFSSMDAFENYMSAAASAGDDRTREYFTVVNDAAFIRMDLMTECKKPETALRRFFKAMRAAGLDYIATGDRWEAEMIEHLMTRGTDKIGRDGTYIALYEEAEFSYALELIDDGLFYVYLNVAAARYQDAPEQPEQPAAAPMQAGRPSIPGARNRAEKRAAGYYNEKILTKFRDALQQARADYAADPDRYNVTISNANSKMGAVASVSLLPFLTCPGCCRTTCGAKCYAAKLANLRPSVLRSYAMNQAIWMADPDKFFRQVRGAMMGVRFFRFHVSGDIPGADYFRRMVSACMDNPHCAVLCFTKAFSIVNGFIREMVASFGPYAAADALPGNLHLLFSGWSNLTPDNPFQLPETNVIEKGAEPADSWKVCGGNCFNCACRGVGCWQACAGDTIAFPIH